MKKLSESERVLDLVASISQIPRRVVYGIGLPRGTPPDVIFKAQKIALEAHTIMLGRLYPEYKFSVTTDLLDNLPTITVVVPEYQCEFCNEHSPKDTWGPGRITCPVCHLKARSVAERQAANGP